MHDIIFVNKEEWDADHCENSKNLFFWDKLTLFLTVDNIFQALIAFLHDNARKIMLILENFDNLANHWVL
jgi:hypothetical protein